MVHNDEDRTTIQARLSAEAAIVIDPVELSTAIYGCSDRFKLDHFGLSGEALFMAMVTNPEAWATFFTSMAASVDWSHSVFIRGRVLAKAPGVIVASDMRAILPQPLFLQILHIIVERRLKPIISQRLRDLGCDFNSMGAMPGMQVMDIKHTIQMFQEVAVDESSRWSIAQSDIRQFYDMISPEKCFMLLSDTEWIETWRPLQPSCTYAQPFN
jgi:hypothetical protein